MTDLRHPGPSRCRSIATGTTFMISRRFPQNFPRWAAGLGRASKNPARNGRGGSRWPSIRIASPGRVRALRRCRRLPAGQRRAERFGSATGDGRQLSRCRCLCELVLAGDRRKLAAANRRGMGARGGGTFRRRSQGCRRRPPKPGATLAIQLCRRGRRQAPGGSAAARARLLWRQFPRRERPVRQCLGVDVDLLCQGLAGRGRERGQHRGELRRPCARGSSTGPTCPTSSATARAAAARSERRRTISASGWCANALGLWRSS